jgi:hypothetical protein
MDKLWLPEGHHYDLHIEHMRATLGAGAFLGGGWKLCWHITVSAWEAVDAMVETVIVKHAEPHFVIGGRRGRDHPTVVQLLPLNLAGRALKHTEPPETNRANVIQVEICAEPDEATARDHGAPMRDVVANWPDWRYKALANLAVLVEHRVPIERKIPRSFTSTKRFTPAGYVRVRGHHGHMHAPIRNDHGDPTVDFKGRTLLRYMDSAPNGL